MAVIEVLTFDVKPGRLDDFLVDVRELRDILARVDVGLTGVRLMDAMLAGADSGRVMLMVENTDLSSWGRSLDNESQDPADQALNARWRSPHAAATLAHRMLLREIPL